MRYSVNIGVFTLLLMLMGCRSGSDTVTMERLLDEMVSFEEHARYPAQPYTCLQESSYDRRSVHPDSPFWFANSDGYGIVRVDTIEGRKENVLFDKEGPGVITRIWITTMNKQGKMRFYFDDAQEAQWEIPAYDLMQTGLPLGKGLLQAHTSYTPEGKGGNTFFLPIPFAKRCKITFEQPDSVKSTPKYYQINYRRYADGTSIETFSPENVRNLKEKLAETDALLLAPPVYKGGECVNRNEKLNPEDSLVVDVPAGTKAIRQLQFDIECDTLQYAQVMRQLIVTINFDGRQTVCVPLSDFSGAGVGAPKCESWYQSANGKGSVISRWVMPYKENAKISLVNLSSQLVTAKLKVQVDNWKWDNRTLYFHAHWKQETNIALSNRCDERNECIDWNFTTLKGRGVYKGDVLSLFNHSPAWYGEGDEKIWVDNDTFPSHFGTGTEDYYNSSWAPVIPFYTPFGGATRADSETSHGYNTFYRTRNLDGIPFDKNLRYDLEMISWANGKADYAVTVFWYGDLFSVANGDFSKPEITRPLLPVPSDPAVFTIAKDALEFEMLTPTDKSSDLIFENQGMYAFAEGKWSRGKQLLCLQGNVGSYLLYEFPATDNKPHHITVYGTKAPDFGILAFAVNGNKLDLLFDGCSAPRYNVENSGPLYLGKFMPIGGKIIVKIELVGKNEKTHGTGFFFGLDCITLSTSHK